MIYLTFLSFFMIGAILGSFYYVVAYRIPRGESIVSPPSHCPNCNHRLGPLELVPIFSYLFQLGLGWQSRMVSSCAIVPAAPPMPGAPSDKGAPQ